MKLPAILAAAVLGLAGFVTPVSALVAIMPPSRPPAPAPEGWAYRYIPPVYQTVSDRTWIPERIQLVQEWVEVRPGRWEQVYRQIVTPGRWEYTTRRVLISGGRWELIRIDPPVVILPPRPIPMPRPILGPGTVGVEGYTSGPMEDLSKFTPLTEWPK